MSLEKILILDDEPIIRSILEEIFRRKKCTVFCAATVAEAEALVQRESFDLLFVDVRLPDGDGQQFLERVSLLPERPLTVMVTGHGSIESAVNCMRAGAFDYLIKPFTPGQIEIVLRKAESYHQLVKVNRYFSESDGDDGELIGRSPAMQRLKQIIDRVAPTDATVLITGESGTGKEMIARELYRHSPRRKEPFIKVNCAAVSSNLIESEFFGHEKGAYTGATDRREGRFELANRGTLLLDEVSEIPLNLQAKLLRVLQEREFERVGGNKTIKVNVRILATSNRSLMQFVEKGEFRQDLYYRLNVFPVQVPALRERLEDVPVLAEHFLRRFARKHGVKCPGFSERARDLMLTYSWPGNVREIQNTVERAVILTENGRPISSAALGLPVISQPLHTVAPFQMTVAGPQMALPLEASAAATDDEMLVAPVSMADHPVVQTAPPPSTPMAQPATSDAAGDNVVPLSEVEKQHIFNALKHTKGNRTQAASMLGISIRTLRNKLNEYRDQGIAVDADGIDG